MEKRQYLILLRELKGKITVYLNIKEAAGHEEKACWSRDDETILGLPTIFISFDLVFSSSTYFWSLNGKHKSELFQSKLDLKIIFDWKYI